MIVTGAVIMMLASALSADRGEVFTISVPLYWHSLRQPCALPRKVLLGLPF